MKKGPGTPAVEVLPDDYSASSLVHEYGGGAFLVQSRILYFSNSSDQRIYRIDEGKRPFPLTPEPSLAKGLRYADGVVTPDGNLIVCVRERHSDEVEPANELVVIPTDGSGEPRVLATGRDFYSSPRLSPDGTKMAWICWDHPNLPWDGNELWVATFAPNGSIKNDRLVAGGVDESIVQPSWSPEGILYFLSDRTGWWNLYSEVDGNVDPVAPMEAEIGGPHWLFALSYYSFLQGGFAVVVTEKGIDRLGIIDAGSTTVRDLGLPYTYVSHLKSANEKLVFIGASPTQPPGVISHDPASGATEVLRRSVEMSYDPRFISIPETIEFPTGEGLTAHAFFYRPKNADFEGPPGEKPPLLIFVHGGPNSRVSSALDSRNPFSIQFWTSRGFAVANVNYSGSSGFGRRYRERLKGKWGVLDVADCVTAARYLCDRGEVAPDRMAIRGASAGGYATLCALTFYDLFKAGANYFGVADMESFAKDTHKFQSRYLESLIGPPEAQEPYRERSPVYFPDRLSAPLITFQGLEDPIVPPSQSERVVKMLEKSSVPYAYVTFEGERHGFARAASILWSAKAELFFFGKFLGFEPADKLEPVEILNLE